MKILTQEQSDELTKLGWVTHPEGFRIITIESDVAFGEWLQEANIVLDPNDEDVSVHFLVVATVVKNP